MRTTHSSFLVAGRTVHRIAFDASTFVEADLLWLPHHAQLAGAGRKRKADHLAGRIAAFHALQAYGVKQLPAIGASGEPLWPMGISGSLTHSGTQALALVSEEPALIGIDCEAILDENEATEIKAGIINVQEERVLTDSGLPFALGLTLAFSAKESLFKALFPRAQQFMDFDTARVINLTNTTLTLTLSQPLAGFDTHQPFTVHWLPLERSVVTLVHLSGS
jgi:enterobactin synthetase component D